MGLSQSLYKPSNWCKITLFSLEVLFMARGPVLGKRRYKDDREDTRHGNAHGNSSNAGIYIGIPLYTRAYRLYMHCWWLIRKGNFKIERRIDQNYCRRLLPEFISWPFTVIIGCRSEYSLRAESDSREEQVWTGDSGSQWHWDCPYYLFALLYTVIGEGWDTCMNWPFSATFPLVFSCLILFSADFQEGKFHRSCIWIVWCCYSWSWWSARHSQTNLNLTACFFFCICLTLFSWYFTIFCSATWTVYKKAVRS